MQYIVSRRDVLCCREGTGSSARPGDRVAAHWSGYTEGIYAKRDNSCTTLLLSLPSHKYIVIVLYHTKLPYTKLDWLGERLTCPGV